MKLYFSLLGCLLVNAFCSCIFPSALHGAGTKGEEWTPGADESVYTISPALNDGMAIHRTILKAYQKGVKRVKIKEGVYRISRPEKDLWHLRFSKLRDFEIDATGATFVFEGRDKRAILFEYCEGVTFKGATLFREIPPFSQGKVTAIAEDRTYADIRIDKGYPMDVDNATYFVIPVIDIYQTGTRKLKPYVPDLYIAKLERLGPDLMRYYFRVPVDPRIPIAVGDPAAWRGPAGSDVSLRTTARMKMLNITIKNAQGAGFQELSGDGGNLFANCTITYAEPPAGAVDQQLLASARDGLLSSGMRKGPTLDNCLFEGLNDDSLNIAGRYALLIESKGNRVVLNAHDVHFRDASFARAGDSLRFYDKHGVLAGEAVVVNTVVKSGYIENPPLKNVPRRFSDLSQAVYVELTLDRPASGEVGGLVANANAIGNGFAVRNCTFRNSRGHGMFIRAGEGLIENCTIEGIMMGGIVVGPEMLWFNEGDYARNLIIRKNTIRNVSTATQNWNSGITVGAFEGGKWVPLPGGHRNILIEDNVFESNRSVNIVLSSVIGVKVVGNKFVNPMSMAPSRLDERAVSNDRALIWMRQASDVHFDRNLVISPGRYMETLVDSDQTVSATGLHDGFKLKNDSTDSGKMLNISLDATP